MRCLPVLTVVLLGLGSAAGQNFTSLFQPWTVEGPISTGASGTASLGWNGDTVTYEVSLFNISGIHAVELHVGERGLHGQVAAVLSKSAFDTMTTVNGIATSGSLADHDLLGPFLLPCGLHLPPSTLYEDYIALGYAFVVVHTMENMGGEVVAYFDGNNTDPSTDMAEFMNSGMMMSSGMAPSMSSAMSPSMARSGASSRP